MTSKNNLKSKKPFRVRLRHDLKINWTLYLMVLPVIAFYILFAYYPMYGAQIAFKNFSPGKGIIDSAWATPFFKHFTRFITSVNFFRVVKNTFMISLLSILFSFPAPIILALLLNELTSQKFKRSVQTISYLPHFISMIVICGMVRDFVASDGIINDLVVLLGGEAKPMLQQPKMFRSIYIISDIWQNVGWGCIIYLAALSAIDPQLYEAAVIDGCGRFGRVIHITIPGIMPTIIILLILRMGRMMNVGFEKIILLYNPATYETADVISSFVYRTGLIEFNWSYSAAIGLFNSVINFILIIVANSISRRFSETSLW